MLREARAGNGFISGRLELDADDVQAIAYEERWQTQADLERQLRSPRYTRLLGLMESASETPSLEFHFVSQTLGLDYVEAVRTKNVR